MNNCATVVSWSCLLFQHIHQSQQQDIVECIILHFSHPYVPNVDWMMIIELLLYLGVYLFIDKSAVFPGTDPAICLDQVSCFIFEFTCPFRFNISSKMQRRKTLPPQAIPKLILVSFSSTKILRC